MTTVHITDDHQMLVELLCMLINESGVAIVTGSSGSLGECRKALQENTPDVLLLDLGLPDGDGIEFCGEIKGKYPDIKVLVLTTHNEYSIAWRVMENKASGFILKSSAVKNVIQGIQTVMEDETFICEEIEKIMKSKKEKPARLTIREKEVLKLICKGYSNKEIADNLFMGVETAKSHHKQIIRKLEAINSPHLVDIAHEQKRV
jgi:DNA-binding NarL/FixJ family response regulator